MDHDKADYPLFSHELAAPNLDVIDFEDVSDLRRFDLPISTGSGQLVILRVLLPSNRIVKVVLRYVRS